MSALEIDRSDWPACPRGRERDRECPVETKSEYSAWSWFLILFGVSAKARRVTWFCRRCGNVFHSTDDPEVLNRDV